MTKKVNILVVEKDGIIAKDIKKILEKYEYTVSAVVISGEEAIEEAKEKKPDLVLTEVKLEGKMDGIEAAHQIYSCFNIPVIFLTAVSDKGTFERAKIVNPYGFIIKPFEEELLHATIEMALYRHSMEKHKMEVNNRTGSKEKNDGYKTSEAGLKSEWTRATFIVKKEHLEKIKALAYWDRKKVKEVVDEALETYLKDKIIEPVNGIEKNK